MLLLLLLLLLLLHELLLLRIVGKCSSSDRTPRSVGLYTYCICCTALNCLLALTLTVPSGALEIVGILLLSSYLEQFLLFTRQSSQALSLLLLLLRRLFRVLSRSLHRLPLLRQHRSSQRGSCRQQASPTVRLMLRLWSDSVAPPGKYAGIRN